MAKPQPLPCSYCLIMLTQIRRGHMPNFGLFGPSVWSWCLDAYIQTCIHTYEPKCVLKWVHGSNSFSPIFIQRFFFFFCTFSLYTPMGRGVARRDPTHVTPKVNFVYVYHVLSLLLQGFVRPKYHFWGLFWPDMDTEMGVVIYMYLKHPPDYIDAKYIWFMVNSLGLSVFADIQFLAFLAIT